MTTDHGPGSGHAGDRIGDAPQRPAGVPFTRTAALWAALIGGLLILIVLLFFVAQNNQPAELDFLVWHVSMPLGVLILLSAVCGGLLAAVVASARMFQLRRAAKRRFAGGR